MDAGEKKGDHAMPVHDWTRVKADIFHHFHLVWLARLSEALNPILPRGYYALAEQHLGRKQGDVLALHASDPDRQPEPPQPPEGGGLAVAEAPPKVSHVLTASSGTRGGRRTLTIRHVTGHRIVALVELISPSNKNGADGLREFVDKVVAALESKIHVVLLDLFPPGRHDPNGVHAVVWRQVDAEEYELPSDKPLTLVSYAAGPPTVAYLEHLAVGDPLRDMPLFLTDERYVYLPLASTYEAAFAGLPEIWRSVLEGQAPPNGA
jgi:hypothetical protein